MKKSLIYISLTFAVTRNEKSRKNISLGEVRRLGLVCGTLFKLIKYSDYSSQRRSRRFLNKKCTLDVTGSTNPSLALNVLRRQQEILKFKSHANIFFQVTNGLRYSKSAGHWLRSFCVFVMLDKVEGKNDLFEVLQFPVSAKANIMYSRSASGCETSSWFLRPCEKNCTKGSRRFMEFRNPVILIIRRWRRCRGNYSTQCSFFKFLNKFPFDLYFWENKFNHCSSEVRKRAPHLKLWLCHRCLVKGETAKWYQ